MFKNTAILILLSTSIQVIALPETPDFALSMTESAITESTMDEARRTLQESSREIGRLIEQRRHQGFIDRTDTTAPQTVSPVLVKAPPCLDISGVYLQGMTLLSLADLDTLSALPDHCITNNDINKLTAEITNLYLAKGYITARVQFIAPNHRGELGLNVVEGFVEAIEGGDHWVNSRMLFPGLINQPLNLNQLDQGLDQSNRLQSNKTTLDILPGSVNGGSIIRLHNRHSTPWRITAITDNYGQKSTGKWISRLNTSIDSPLGLSDFISFSGVSTIPRTADKPNTQYNRAATLFYSLPYGAVTFSGFTSYSRYTSRPKLQKHSSKLHGNSQQSGVRMDWIFHRNQSQLSTVNSQFVYKNYNNYFGIEKLRHSSQTLTVFSLGISHLQITPSGLITFDAGIEQGTPWFGAQTSTNNLNKQFTKGKLSVNLQQHFKLFAMPYRFNSQFYAQYSPKGLPSVEWLNITDRNTVRGFSNNTLSADNGWYLRNTLSHSIPLSESSLTLRIGADIGQIKSYNHQEPWKSNAGLSVGIALRYQHFFADVEMNRGKTLAHKNKGKDEPIQLLTRFSYTF
ncbi:ShlB/FhaC/HecB family hemolysin secretion/activation protein [Xenorhabdus cabanillasii]|uniref:XhlB (TpsB protein) n=1 Tax=Xenorhabdus cabanillasii JM26 TaxID=1427517 RepID=W1JC32_9GAMM|nr:ShlB/FhaC/HecB family hemolysin secretion/activation protein [Xenorhabdus cabanillasii]PHM79194.1 XhlB [Xenorhabdus cabanillasii JM26]CDL87591.1 XhlB (TpsB protein) [Xenorhabdus cabanillasii JM26]